MTYCEHGATSTPVTYNGIGVVGGSQDNMVGQAAEATRNLICTGSTGTGITFGDPNTRGNKVYGNWFGVAADGRTLRSTPQGIKCTYGAGKQLIGSLTEGAGNTFCVTQSAGYATGVYLDNAGQNSSIKGNSFGTRPDGTDADAYWMGVHITGAKADVVGNRIAGAEFGMLLQGTPVTTRVFRNSLRNCEQAIKLEAGGRALLGNLNNGIATDDGGNSFGNSNTWFIRNETVNFLRAEGSTFPDASAAAIDAKIWDQLDVAGLGLVDYKPMAGGEMPTGSTGTLVLRSVTAAETARGAQVVFSLSAPAAVSATARNVAGRTVAALWRARECEAGTNSLLWSGLDDQGLRVPNGAYLIELTARSGDGIETRAIAQVRLGYR